MHIFILILFIGGLAANSPSMVCPATDACRTAVNQVPVMYSERLLAPTLSVTDTHTALLVQQAPIDAGYPDGVPFYEFPVSIRHTDTRLGLAEANNAISANLSADTKPRKQVMLEV